MSESSEALVAEKLGWQVCRVTATAEREVFEVFA
jgi:hypothetical protein